MIGIFSGRGIADAARVHAQIDVDFRNHVHVFNQRGNLNALAIFMCIALHADKDGWAWPSRDLLKRETGLSSDGAITNAIQHLRKMAIEGVRVLAHYRLKDKKNKRWDRSLYLIFPDLPHGEPPQELIEGCDVFIVTDNEPVPINPPPAGPGVAQPEADAPGVAQPGYKKNHEEPEPSEAEPSKDTSSLEKANADSRAEFEALFGKSPHDGDGRQRHPDPVGEVTEAFARAVRRQSPAEAVTDAFVKYAGEMPEQQRERLVAHFARIIENWGGATAEQAVEAWRWYREKYGWKGEVNPYYASFEDEYGLLLQKVKSGKATQSQPRSSSPQDRKPSLVDERTDEEKERLRQRIRAHAERRAGS